MMLAKTFGRISNKTFCKISYERFSGIKTYFHSQNNGNNKNGSDIKVAIKKIRTNTPCIGPKREKALINYTNKYKIIREEELNEHIRNKKIKEISGIGKKINRGMMNAIIAIKTNNNSDDN
eukprot:533026_1